MPANRIYYATRAVGFAVDGSQVFITAHGVQQLGITTDFNLDFVYEMGKVAAYDILEEVPAVEVTLEKVLDSNPLLYHLATKGATSGSIAGRSAIKTILATVNYTDTATVASGAPLAEAQVSGLVWSSLSYNISVDGECRESLSLVGNSEVWRDLESSGSAVFSGGMSASDKPYGNTNVASGIMRRQNVVFAPAAGSPTGLDANGMTNAWMTVLPTNIKDVTSSGTCSLTGGTTGTAPTVPVQSIAVSVDAGRQDILQLGARLPYFKYMNLPVQVRTEIEVSATKMDTVNTANYGPAQTIRVRLTDGTMLDMGQNNKLSNVSYSGGDTGGGNLMIRYTYMNANDLVVSHPLDPSGL